MVYKILSIAAKILFSIAGLVGVVCFVWTMATPAVQEGIDSITGSINSAVNDATQAMQVEWGIDFSGVFEPAEGAGSGDGGFDLVESLKALFGGFGASRELEVGDFANAAYGEAYLTWKGKIDDPIGSIFAGTDVTISLIEGVVAGSSSAANELAGLDEAALALVSSNALAYSNAAASNAVPSTLPQDVRLLMWEANSSAQGFASSVQSVVAAARNVKAGSVAALAELATAADALLAEYQTMQTCMKDAEALLLK